MQIYNSGLAVDPRTPEEKAKDYQHPEGAIILNWVEKTPDKWKKYIPREQDGSLSCYAQASAKAVEILTGKVLSAHPPYYNRANYPGGGMYTQNVGDLWKNIGSTLESLDVSQNLSESKMNLQCSVTKDTKIGKYFFLNPKNIDSIAEAIELNKHCLLVVHCYKSEWKAIPVSNGQSSGGYDFGHAICAVDYFLYNGKKTILIEDSTGHFNSFDKHGQRLISEDFLKARFEGAMYFTLPVPVVPPTFKFTKTLRFGQTNDDVKQLQKFLSVLPQSGYFGNKTLGAVKTFQQARGLTVDGIVGPITRAELNKYL